MPKNNSNNDSKKPVLGAIIVGSGFAGIGMAIQLDRAGISDFLIVEKAAEVGGTWRDNHYPGAGCDVPSHLYSYSFEPRTNWPHKYARQPEIHAYLQHCVSKYQLRSRLRLNCELSSAEFDEAEGHWRVTTATGDTLHCRALITGCGQLNRPLMPKLDGIEQFAGAAFHSARWQPDVALSGKRVAVIGTGASAIQFVPQIVPQVASLDLFQRSAPYVLPKDDREYDAKHRARLQRFAWLHQLDRAWQYCTHEVRALGFVYFPSLVKHSEKSALKHLHKQIRDPQKRAALTPDYPMGCKRILISNNYYPALAQDKVALVTDPIDCVVPDGIKTRDGQIHPADVIIYGTGFAATEFLAPLRITGLQGRDLSSEWQRGAEAYKGISASGFPNLFMLYGPNTNLGHNSIVYMLESQFRYVVQCLQTLRRRRLRYLDVRSDVQLSYNQRLQHNAKRTVWAQGCSSWYLTAEGKQTVNWPGFTFAYRHQTRKPRLSDYDCVR
ncbi:Predicted flavoprotein CzcO associated with the cation diffusion facilitator CzcD [Halopseudomonas sabulinigri]|uniref:Predicted flavoprotein CzcO associated with the cation diffusion facilitator CzcD n=1 Tax=Halopseudomonas sabulinigri TaxID=472181 RepID=A0A1H1SI54_9GAMM|nr:NAD(P)/FAD-dependent oxidoreductase [Halopseudomonas sabulinigri]SDS47621.1 Predicted flavoprotein CzcO associated with the cation diffusion facilitator CzcD [Halopseudomonas sabulinigri]